MPRAFVLLNAELGYEGPLAEEMKKLPGVKEAYAIYGVYDIMLKVSWFNGRIKRTLLAKIRRMNGVKSTLTMLIMEKASLN